MAALRLLAKVGLLEKADAFPRALSGGQQQRIAIARALAMEPKLMLFDEVTSALDLELKGEVLRVMRTLADEGMTMVVVHELGFAREVADRAVFMEAGKIVETSTPQQMFEQPHSKRTRQFLGLAGAAYGGCRKAASSRRCRGFRLSSFALSCEDMSLSNIADPDLYQWEMLLVRDARETNEAR